MAIALTTEDVRSMTQALGQEHLMEERLPQRLESCLSTVFPPFSGDALYPTLVDKASNLFYLMAKDHPFPRRNVQMAITALLVFLSLNGSWIKVDPQILHDFAVWVSQSPPEQQGETIRGITTFITKNLVTL